MIAGPICEWVSASVFARHFHLAPPQGLIMAWHSLVTLAHYPMGWNQHGLTNIKCSILALPHISYASCWNSLNNKLSYCSLLANSPMLPWQQNPTLNHTFLGWVPDISPITCSWELKNPKDSMTLTAKLSGTTIASHTKHLVLTAVGITATGLEYLYLPWN